MLRPPTKSTFFPYPPLSRSVFAVIGKLVQPPVMADLPPLFMRPLVATDALAFYLFKLIFPLHLAPDYGRTPRVAIAHGDRKSTRLNSSHGYISYAVFCLNKK